MSAVPLRAGTPEPAELEEWLVDQVRACLPRPPAEIPRDLPLVNLGLDSVSGVALVGTIEDHFDIELLLDVLADQPTVSDLARIVLEQLEMTE